MDLLPECCVCKSLGSGSITLPPNAGVYLIRCFFLILVSLYNLNNATNILFLFNRFPQNLAWRKNWLDALKYSPALPIIRQTFRSFMDLFICSMHFDDDCFSHGFLKTNAIPTKFLVSNRPKQVKILLFVCIFKNK